MKKRENERKRERDILLGKGRGVEDVSLTDGPRFVPRLHPGLAFLLVLDGDGSHGELGVGARRYQVESDGGGGDLGHLRLQHLRRLRGFSQLDIPLARAVRVRGDALVSGVVALVQRHDHQRGQRAVAQLLDHVVVVDPLVAVHGPADGGVRYALGYAADVHGLLLPRPDALVRHRGERRRELHRQVTVPTRLATRVIRDALVQAVVRSQRLADRQPAHRLAVDVVGAVGQDDSIVVQLRPLHVRLIVGQLPEGDVRRRPAERLAHQASLSVLHHAAVQELHDLRLHDHVHADVRVRLAGQVRRRALVLAGVLAVHVRDGQYAGIGIHSEAIGVRQILMRQRLHPGEFRRRFTLSPAPYVRVFTFDHVHRREFLHRRSYVNLLNQTQT